MKVFVPITDDALETLQDSERLIPYRPGLPLLGELPACSPDPAVDLSRDPAPAHPRAAPPIQPPFHR